MFLFKFSGLCLPPPPTDSPSDRTVFIAKKKKHQAVLGSLAFVWLREAGADEVTERTVGAASDCALAVGS